LEKGYLFEKRRPFFCGDSRYAGRYRREKIMKKRYCERFLFVFGAVCMLMTGCGTRESSKMDTKDMTIRDADFHTELFGDNTYIFSPEDEPEKVAGILDQIYEKQEANQFGNERYAIYFMPGEYDESIEANVGFYTQVAGLGELPTDTKLKSLQCNARWLSDDPSNHNACCNFWRGVENIELKTNTVWAVSQATFMRRVQVDGALFLHDDYGWCSGGFLADSNTDLMTDSGSQQQWLSRNCNWKVWMGANWNMVFVGTKEGKNPQGTWPVVPYTAVEKTEVMQEKPFLIYDDEAGYMVYVPKERENATGVSWENGSEGEKIPIEQFYVAKPEKDTAETMNQALEEGKNLLLTPGIYDLTEPIVVNRADTIVLGMGLATLRAANGTACMETGDVQGLIIAGLLFDSGETKSDNLLVVGTEKEASGDAEKNNYLSDLFFRVGGTDTEKPVSVKCCATINSDHVIGDNFWVWRADHGDNVAWDENEAENGIIINGDDVTMYALMVEHFKQYQTIWNGNRGKVYMYQSEIPYDVPAQEVWMSHEGQKNGYASFYVDEAVDTFEAWGLGVYLYNRDAAVELDTAMEVPDREGVKVHNICTVMLTGYPGMNHIINESGDSVTYAGQRNVICEYENGVVR
jgi:hypothetical protein